MTYDFTSILDRSGKDAIAVDMVGKGGFAPLGPKDGFDIIPMWVADMNFPTLPSIQEAIIRRAQHPCFGYFEPTQEYYDSIIRWQEDRNGVTGLTADCIGYENGVLGGVMSALACLAAPGDPVLVHSPTYIGFTNLLKNNGYRIVHSPLKLDENGVWRMDYEDMDAKLKKYHIHAAIFCSPHNPCGRVWERWELEKALEVYQANHCTVISDEIWSDLILEGHKHIPVQMVKTTAHTKPPYYPGGCELTIKLFCHKETKALLGVQLAGLEGAASRIGMCALAIDAGVTCPQLAMADLGYAPPFNYVWDPVQLAAGMVK